MAHTWNDVLYVDWIECVLHYIITIPVSHVCNYPAQEPGREVWMQHASYFFVLGNNFDARFIMRSMFKWSAMSDKGPVLTSGIIFYLSIGAAIFQILEEPNWKLAKSEYSRQKENILKTYPCLTKEDLNYILGVCRDSIKNSCIIFPICVLMIIITVLSAWSALELYYISKIVFYTMGNSKV